MRSSYVRRLSFNDNCPHDSKKSRTWSDTSSTCVGHRKMLECQWFLSVLF